VGDQCQVVTRPDSTPVQRRRPIPVIDAQCIDEDMHSGRWRHDARHPGGPGEALSVRPPFRIPAFELGSCQPAPPGIGRHRL
jgi:hypothetical protein